MTGVAALEQFALLEPLESPLLASDPATVFAEIHQLPGPGIFRNPLENGLVATRYETLKWIAQHPSFQSQNQAARGIGPGQGGSLQALFSNHPVFMNEPLHFAVNRVAQKAILWPGAESIQVAVTQLANEIVGPLLERREVDLVADYCFVLSSRYWAQALGLPSGAASELKAHTSTLGAVSAFSSTQQDRDNANLAAEHISRLVEQGQASVGRRKEDSLYGMVESLLGDIDLADRPSSASRLLASLTFDSVDGAGGMASNLLACLLKEPENIREVRNKPLLTANAWAEATRLAPALLGLYRCPIEDVNYEGFILPAGVNVFMLNAAGNQDPKVFTDPADFKLMRKESAPLSFGGGARACVGRMLAKILGKTALEVLLERTKALNLMDEYLDWGPPGLLRTIRTLKVRIQPR